MAVCRLEGVTGVSVSVGTETMTLTHKSDADLQVVEQAIRRLGYTVTRAAPASAASVASASKPKRGWWQSCRALLVGACGIGVAGRLRHRTAYEKGAFLAALGVGLVPIARRAFAAARGGTPFSIEMQMSVAAGRRRRDRGD